MFLYQISEFRSSSEFELTVIFKKSNKISFQDPSEVEHKKSFELEIKI